MESENYAQKIVQHIKKADADRTALLSEHTLKTEPGVGGITIRQMRDGSVLVCDHSDGQQADPHWYERHATEWIGEGEEGKKRLAATEGTCWVVHIGASTFRVFEIEADADHYYHEQLRLGGSAGSPASVRQPVRYIGGRQTP